MAHKTFGEFFRYSKLNKYEGLEGKIPLRYSDIFMGVEVETEDTYHRCTNIPGSFKAVDDGSLKLAGKEFVTVPIKLGYLEKELERLFAAIPQASFSCRTSIHIHMNARDFTVQNMIDFTMIYTLFEKNLYNYSGDRWNNNFCIPLRVAPNHLETLLSYAGENTEERDERLLNNDITWSKYLGLNLSPLTGSREQSRRYGTIEFRHMKGNNNIHYIINWCNLITCMKFYAKSVNSEALLTLIKENKGYTIAKDVFKQWYPLVISSKEDEDEVKEANSFLKYCLNVNNRTPSIRMEGIFRAVPTPPILYDFDFNMISWRNAELFFNRNIFHADYPNWNISRTPDLEEISVTVNQNQHRFRNMSPSTWYSTAMAQNTNGPQAIVMDDIVNEIIRTRGT